MLRVVLVRPLGPRNVGSVLRAVCNFGPAELCIVRPIKPSLLVHPDFVQMSHGVEDVVRRVRVVDSVAAALADCTLSYGFSARARDHRVLSDWNEAAPGLIQHAHDEHERLALVFGCEENGLTAEETDPVQRLIRMPTSDEHSSINLAMTVAITLSTIFFARASSARKEPRRRVVASDRELLVAVLKGALGARTTSAPARRDLLASIERVFGRAQLETRDVRAWHLLARALGVRKGPAGLGLAGEGGQTSAAPKPEHSRRSP